MGASDDLARRSDLERWLGLSSGDDSALLETLIGQTSRAILGFLDRPAILPETYVESHDGGNEFAILLRQWPVIRILSCEVNGISIPESAGFGPTSGIGYVVDRAAIMPPGRMQRLSLRGGAFAYGVQNVSICYCAGYQVTDELGIVAENAPYVVSARAPYGAFGRDVAVTDSTGTALVRVTGDPQPGQYVCSDGTYTFSAEHAGAAVSLTYGYVPADIGRCCIEWAADQYQYRTRIGQHTKSLGGQEAVSFIVKDIPDFVRAVLQPYRRVVAP